MRSFSRLLIYMIIALIGVTAQAQDTSTCPANVQLNFARAAAACASTLPDQACYGSGTVTTSTFDDNTALTQPGDTTSLINLREVSTDSNDATWSTATLSFWTTFDRAQRRTATAWLFGDATLVNLTVASPEQFGITIGSAALRELPNESSFVYDTVPVNTALTVNGRSEDGLWYRVFVPNFSAVGWVSSSLMPSIDFPALTIADPNVGYARPFQIATLTTGVDDSLCADAPESGMMLQAPPTNEPGGFVINGAAFYLYGTAFLQAEAEESMSINLIDGYAELVNGEESVYLPSGSRTVVGLDTANTVAAQPLDAEPYDVQAVSGVPLTNLPLRVRELPQPLTLEQIDTLTTEFTAAQQQQGPDPNAVATLDSTCRRVMARPDDLRAGPGMFYEVAGGLMRGAQISPILQATDADGAIWYQISSGPWVPFSSVIESGICREVPTSNTAPPPPNNELIMETCESTNGPLRGGQRVIIQFTPPTWETIGEALIAPRIDPGRILVDGLLQSIYVFDPVRITPTAVARTFAAEWTATTGTHHITGERLSYSLICDLTISAG